MHRNALCDVKHADCVKQKVDNKFLKKRITKLRKMYLGLLLTKLGRRVLGIELSVF